MCPLTCATRRPTPWRLVVGLRNRLIHAYLSIEPETVWLIITEHLPSLRARLATLAAEGQACSA